MNKFSKLNVKIFADGANLADMLTMYREPYIQGFTTNPTLMHKAGIRDYESFAREVLAAIPDRPISFEVFSDDFAEMERQSLRIASWGSNVYVKIPVTNTEGESSRPLLCRLARMGVRVNVTAMMTAEQIDEVLPALAECPAGYLSIFAGRIADTGRDPLGLMKLAVSKTAHFPHVEIIWASPREVFNVAQASEIGCHVITATTDILKKLPLLGKDLNEYSLDTIKMFSEDAKKAGFEL